MRVTCWLAHFRTFLMTVKKIPERGEDGKSRPTIETTVLWRPCLRGGES